MKARRHYFIFLGTNLLTNFLKLIIMMIHKMYTFNIYIIFFKVKSVHQQPGFKRVKRGYKSFNPSLYVNRDEYMTGSSGYSGEPVEIDDDQNRYGKLPMDPLFKEQWYLRNTGQNGGKPRLDLNVRAAWAQGVSGKNVTTAIMDDGK